MECRVENVVLLDDWGDEEGEGDVVVVVDQPSVRAVKRMRVVRRR